MTSLFHFISRSGCIPPTSTPRPPTPNRLLKCVAHCLLAGCSAGCLLMLCLLKGLLKCLLGCYGLLLCFGSLSFAIVLLKHAMVACFRQWLPVIYKLVCLKFNSLSKYHAEPPTLTRLGASADFLSIELK